MRGNGPLGLSIMGGYDQTCFPFGGGNPGIFVSRVRFVFFSLLIRFY